MLLQDQLHWICWASVRSLVKLILALESALFDKFPEFFTKNVYYWIGPYLLPYNDFKKATKLELLYMVRDHLLYKLQ